MVAPLLLKHYVIEISHTTEKLGLALVAGEEKALTAVSSVGEKHSQHILCPYVVKEGEALVKSEGRGIVSADKLDESHTERDVSRIASPSAQCLNASGVAVNVGAYLQIG